MPICRRDESLTVVTLVVSASAESIFIFASLMFFRPLKWYTRPQRCICYPTNLANTVVFISQCWVNALLLGAMCKRDKPSSLIRNVYTDRSVRIPSVFSKQRRQYFRFLQLVLTGIGRTTTNFASCPLSGRLVILLV